MVLVKPQETITLRDQISDRVDPVLPVGTPSDEELELFHKLHCGFLVRKVGVRPRVVRLTELNDHELANEVRRRHSPKWIPEVLQGPRLQRSKDLTRITAFGIHADHLELLPHPSTIQRRNIFRTVVAIHGFTGFTVIHISSFQELNGLFTAKITNHAERSWSSLSSRNERHSGKTFSLSPWWALARKSAHNRLGKKTTTQRKNVERTESSKGSRAPVGIQKIMGSLHIKLAELTPRTRCLHLYLI